jgi:hypothetical protein
MPIRFISVLFFFGQFTCFISPGSQATFSGTSLGSKGRESIVLVKSGDIRSSSGLLLFLLSETIGFIDDSNNSVDGGRFGALSLSVILDKSEALVNGRVLVFREWRGMVRHEGR